MSRSRAVPSYPRHKSSGQAVVPLTDVSGQRHGEQAAMELVSRIG